MFIFDFVEPDWSVKIGRVFIFFWAEKVRKIKK